MTSTQRPPELSEEELRAYLEQLREAEVSEILVQAYTMLGTGAEVKIGRPDARILIDAMAGLVQGAGSRIGELGQRMQAGVQQLQVAQVQAEQAASRSQADQEPGAGEAQQAQQGQQPQQQPPPSQASPGGGEQQRMTDRLWIPGRDPGPRPR